MIIFGSGIGALIGLPFLIILFLVVVILLPITGIVTLSGKKDENRISNEELIRRKIDAINCKLEGFQIGEYVFIERNKWTWYSYYRIINIEKGKYHEVKRIFGHRLEIISIPRFEIEYIGEMYHRKWEYFDSAKKHEEYINFRYGRNYCYVTNFDTIEPEHKRCYQSGVEKIEYEEIKKIPGFREKR